MEAKTRVKKYEELRETLLKDNLENQETPKLSRFAKRLSNIDSEYFQPIVESYERDAKKEIVIPQRVMKEEVEIEQDEYFNEQEILSRALRVTSQNQDSSDDELLNQFLKEIRNYNKKQGVRSVDDTRMEILKQVRVESEEVKEAPTKEKKVQSNNPVRESIAKQVRDMLKTQENEPVESSSVLIDLNEDDEEDVKEDKYLLVLQEERVNRAKILEETQQLRLKLNEHEDELEDIGSGIDYTRKLLNVLLLLLMITVLIAGGILAYLVMKG